MTLQGERLHIDFNIFLQIAKICCLMLIDYILNNQNNYCKLTFMVQYNRIAWALKRKHVTWFILYQPLHFIIIDCYILPQSFSSNIGL